MTIVDIVERCAQIVLERNDNQYVTAWAIRREFGLTDEGAPGQRWRIAQAAK